MTFLRAILARFWWPAPYDPDRLCPMNTWTSAIRNVVRRRRGEPELGPLDPGWVAEGLDMGSQMTVLALAWMLFGRDVVIIALFWLAIGLPVVRLAARLVVRAAVWAVGRLRSS